MIAAVHVLEVEIVAPGQRLAVRPAEDPEVPLGVLARREHEEHLAAAPNDRLEVARQHARALHGQSEAAGPVPQRRPDEHAHAGDRLVPEELADTLHALAPDAAVAQRHLPLAAVEEALRE